jgi:hypothetical protein
VTQVDDKGLRLAREVRKAIREREENRDLAAAVEVYDRAVTPAERSAAASYLLLHSTQADRIYKERLALACLRMCAPELLPERER